MAITALTALALHVNDEWRDAARSARHPPGLRPGQSRAPERALVGRGGGPAAAAHTIGQSRCPGSSSCRGSGIRRCFRWWRSRRDAKPGLKGRIFNDFIWGGYLLKEWPEQKVFLDGQTDFYGEDLARQHMRIMALLSRVARPARQVEHRAGAGSEHVVAGPRAGAGPRLAHLPLRFHRGAAAARAGGRRLGLEWWTLRPRPARTRCSAALRCPEPAEVSGRRGQAPFHSTPPFLRTRRSARRRCGDRDNRHGHRVDLALGRGCACRMGHGRSTPRRSSAPGPRGGSVCLPIT